jgi:hypothetical protein
MASRLLTTKIPSALLVAVRWLQHTRYPRFRRGTFGYGVTTSPIQKGKAKGTEFSCECTLVYPCFPNAYAMQCMLKSNIFNLQHKVLSKTGKNKFRTEESIEPLLDTKLVGHRTWLITTSINNAYKDHFGKRYLIKALYWWGFSELPNNIGKYNAG